MPPETPELHKLRKMASEKYPIGDFLSWLNDNDMVVVQAKPPKYIMNILTVDQIRSGFFELDHEKIQSERSALSEWERQCNAN